jgi:iron(III) transport system ATP-binding protein
MTRRQRLANSRQPTADSRVTEPFLRVDNLQKVFDGGAAPAVDGVSFGVARGKMLTLLGPSGCGKTTTLRCIAGLENPTAGTISIEGEPVTSVERGLALPPERRNVGMVFQSYAVWPHMTVAQNVALPLEVRRVHKPEIRRRVLETLELVGLSGLEDRYANRLSGGQQQRVALARALIYNPRLLLFDEPLSNLDAKLRERMRHEIRRLQQEVGITSVYVTHDQAEAMIISDEIIVMNRGRIEQQGDARSLYSRPATGFVANFIGVANLVPGTVVANDGERYQVRLDLGQGRPVNVHASSPDSPGADRPSPGTAVHLSIRPEDILLHRQQPAGRANILLGQVVSVGYLGNLVDYLVQTEAQTWRVQTHPSEVFSVEETVHLELPPAECLCLPAAMTESTAAPEIREETEVATLPGPAAT